MPPTSNLLPPLGFTLPLVGENHPLRKRFLRTFLWSATMAMLIAAFAASVRIALSHNHSSAIPPVRPHPPVPVTIIPLSDTALDFSSGAILVGNAKPLPGTTPVPVPDYDASDLTVPSDGGAPAGNDDVSPTSGNDAIAPSSGDGIPAPDEYVAVEEMPQLINAADVQRATIDLYPEIAKSAGVEGTVNLKVYVGKTGEVEKVIVMDGPEMLRDAAKQAVLRARFKPALQQHHPVGIWVAWALEFSLEM